jgi:protein TonB
VAACAPKPDDYPGAAVRAEATGITTIRFTIGPDGALSDSRIVRSAGPSREHKMLDRVVLRMLSGCSFRAGIDENGRPMGGTFEQSYEWRLE